MGLNDWQYSLQCRNTAIAKAPNPTPFLLGPTCLLNEEGRLSAKSSEELGFSICMPADLQEVDGSIRPNTEASDMLALGVASTNNSMSSRFRRICEILLGFQRSR